MLDVLFIVSGARSMNVEQLTLVQTGRTLVKRLPTTRTDAIVDAERALYRRLADAPVSGSVELF